MKMLKRIIVVLCLCFLTIDECHSFDFDKGKIVATHYTGSTWAPSFWSNLDIDKVPEDFVEIKKNGFNTIVLVVPWVGFQYSLEPILYNDEYFNLLNNVILIAKNFDLQVIIRIGYAHELGETKSSPTHSERITLLNADRKTLDAWISYVKRLYDIASRHDNFLFGFISWEDLFLLDFMRLPVEHRLTLAQQSGFYDYIKTKPIKELSDSYEKSFSSYLDVPIPYYSSPAVIIFHKFWDDYLLDVFAETKKHFPDLSMEVRVDCDPSNNGDGYICHESTFDLNGDGDITIIYYTPAWGAENKGNFSDADSTISRFEYLLDKVKSKTDNAIFIDQFNFIDNTPGFERNTRIYPGELPQFIDKSAPLIMKETVGYSLWALEDLKSNWLVNSSFEQGIKGWKLINGKHVTKTIDNEFEILLENSGFIEQAFNLGGVAPPVVDKAKKFTVQFDARNSSESSSKISITIKDVKGRVIEQVNREISPRTSEQITCDTFPIIKKGSVVIGNIGGEIFIDKVVMFFHVQKSGIYDINAQPKDFRDNIVRLNEFLVTDKTLPEYYNNNNFNDYFIEGIYSDGWVLEFMSGKISVPLNNDKGKKIVLELYVPEQWKGYANNITLKINNMEIGRNDISNSYNKLIYDVPPEVIKESPVSFIILSEKSYLASVFEEKSTDTRKLSFVLIGFGFP